MNAKVRPTFADVTIFSPTRKQIDDDGAMIEVTSHDAQAAQALLLGGASFSLLRPSTSLQSPAQPHALSSSSLRPSRRQLLQSTITSCLLPILHPKLAVAFGAEAVSTLPPSVTLPAQWIPALGAYVVHFMLFDEVFGAILDTGSPFLTVPFRCNKFSYKYRWGCYHPERTRDSSYTNTVERFANNEGIVVWRKANFSFVDTDNSTSTGSSSESSAAATNNSQDVVFGVLGEDLMDGPGGVFFGLIRETDAWIRPSFLAQTGYTSFIADFRVSPKLVLSKHSLIRDDNDSNAASSSDYIPLVRDLHQFYHAPVVHYAALADGLVINGIPQDLGQGRRPGRCGSSSTYVIFDTGSTGLVLSQKLWDRRYQQARQNREKSLWGKVQLSFRTAQGNTIMIEASRPVTTSLGNSLPFRGFKGNLVVVGLAFLDGRALVIDSQNDKLQILLDG